MPKNLAIFVLGVIIGATILNLIYANTIDHLYWQKEDLKISLFEATERLSKLEEQLATSQEPVVREIKIEIDVEKNSFTELSLREKIGEITGDLVGENINDLSPSVIYRMLDGRYLTLEDEGHFQIRVDSIIISEQIIFYLHCAPVDD